MTSSDTALVSRVERTIRQQRLFSPGDTLVVAFSGGADSTALLDLLSRLPDYNLHLVAAHLNHCLRGDESDSDQEFCQGLASRYNIPFEARRIDVKKVAEKSRLNFEDAGRRTRIEFIDDICRKYGAAAAVLAHHADDQAETVLMRILRGSGTTGLSGMAYRNSRGYVRPLLDLTRSEIEQYLLGRDLEWREDSSNSDAAYLRNRIRHQLLPLLEGYNPAIRTCLAATASILTDDEALLSELTEQEFARSCRAGEGEVVCSVAQFRTLSSALRRRVLRRAFKQVAGTLEGLSQRHIEALCDTIDSDRPNSRLALPHAVSAIRAYDRMVLTRKCAALPETDLELIIAGPGRYQLPWGGAIMVEFATPAALSADPAMMYCDPFKSPFPWLVRTFRPGDRMVPFGMSGRKKVKDIFIDRKIPLAERSHTPLLLCGDELIWVAGVCAAELCRIDTPSAAAVRVSWQAPDGGAVMDSIVPACDA